MSGGGGRRKEREKMEALREDKINMIKTKRNMTGRCVGEVEMVAWVRQVGEAGG